MFVTVEFQRSEKRGKLLMPPPHALADVSTLPPITAMSHVVGDGFARLPVPPPKPVAGKFQEAAASLQLFECSVTASPAIIIGFQLPERLVDGGVRGAAFDDVFVSPST